MKINLYAPSLSKQKAVTNFFLAKVKSKKIIFNFFSEEEQNNPFGETKALFSDVLRIIKKFPTLRGYKFCKNLHSRNDLLFGGGQKNTRSFFERMMQLACLPSLGIYISS
ncbi:MAG: hypothetical protein A2007_05875 [Verrucomicrobia bacterium GWC2_42_7]|nr:MAG: hypothetical protein A2007_05875 [Verrucomicrobia bacterium GWC2_42_7]